MVGRLQFGAPMVTGAAMAHIEAGLGNGTKVGWGSVDIEDGKGGDDREQHFQGRIVLENEQ